MKRGRRVGEGTAARKQDPVTGIGGCGGDKVVPDFSPSYLPQAPVISLGCGGKIQHALPQAF